MSNHSAVTPELEPVITGIEKLSLASRDMLRSAASLRPGMAMMQAAAEGNEEACLIRDSWRFNFPVTVIKTRAEFDALVEKGTVNFGA
jgi:hypothetical protein